MIKKIIYLSVISILTAFYLWGTTQHSNLINTRTHTGDIDHGDQKAHIEAIKKIREDNFWYLGDRNRMPLYDHIQAAFYTKGVSDEQLFYQGKFLNIVLSLFLVWAIFIFNSRYLSEFSNVVFTLIISFAIFLPKAAYLQPELLYYTLFFMAFVYFCRTIKTRSVFDAILSGFFAAIAQLTKASMLLGFTVFAGTFLISNFNIKHKSKNLIIPAITILTFLFILAPYLIQTKKLYGKYFFNYSTTYFWADNWNEVLELDERYHNPEVIKSLITQIPSPAKYFREHTFIQTALRILTGVVLNIGILLGTYATASSAIFIFYLFFLIFFIFSNIRATNFQKYINQNKTVIAFILGYLLLHFLAFSWYAPIGAGPRFTFPLYMPALFSTFYLLERLTIKGWAPKSNSTNIRLFYLAHIISMVILFLGVKTLIFPYLFTSWAGF